MAEETMQTRQSSDGTPAVVRKPGEIGADAKAGTDEDATQTGQTNHAEKAPLVCSNRELMQLIGQAFQANLLGSEQADIVDKLRLKIALMPEDVANSEAASDLHDLLSLSRAPEMALDAIDSLFEPEDVVELRALDPTGGGAQAIHGLLRDPSDRAALLSFICMHIGRCNLYFGANPRELSKRGSDKASSSENVTGRRSIAFDLDFKDGPDCDPLWEMTRQGLRGLSPVLELESGNGVQIWFRIKYLDRQSLLSSIAELSETMARVGADNTADLSRIMRLPFTVNLPTALKRKRGNVPCFALPYVRSDEGKHDENSVPARTPPID